MPSSDWQLSIEQDKEGENCIQQKNTIILEPDALIVDTANAMLGDSVDITTETVLPIEHDAEGENCIQETNPITMDTVDNILEPDVDTADGMLEDNDPVDIMTEAVLPIEQDEDTTLTDEKGDASIVDTADDMLENNDTVDITTEIPVVTETLSNEIE